MTNEQAYVILENCASLLDSGTRFFTEDHVKQFHEAYELAMMALQKTERKPGRWELLPLSTITPVYKCSACGRHAVWITTGCLVNRHKESYLSDFCPNCGADMRGEQDE